LGLYYYKARIYSPTLGRFLQTDPVGYKNDLNWYASTIIVSRDRNLDYEFAI
jgi:RHS repeat-associated protein